MDNPDPNLVSLPFISAYTFRCMAKQGWLSSPDNNEYMSRLPNGIDPKAVREGDFLYITTDLIERFFQRVDIQIEVPYVLISGLAPRAVDDQAASAMSANVLHWYAQHNCSGHPCISTIPVGLQNMHWRTLGNPQSDVSLLERIAAEDIEPSMDILLSFTVATNELARQACVDYFSTQKNIVTFRPFTSRTRSDRTFVSDFFREIRHHKFVICPFGRGFDCYRNWETFSLGSIPIIKKHKSMKAFYDMPAWFVDDWSDVNQYTMAQKYDEMKSDWESFNHEKKFFRYWERMLSAPK